LVIKRIALLSGSALERAGKMLMPDPSSLLAEARSVLIVSGLLTIPFASQGRLDPLFFPRFQIKGMFLDFLDDVLLLNLSLKAAQRVFQRFAFLQSYFCQLSSTPISV
jgi:hypothetical protein